MSLPEIKAMFCSLGEMIAKLEQQNESKPFIRSDHSNATKPFDPSRLSTSSQSAGVTLESETFTVAQNNLLTMSCLPHGSFAMSPKPQSVNVTQEFETYFIDQNNFSHVSDQPHCSSELLAEPQFVKIDQKSKTSVFAHSSILPNWIVQVHKKDKFNEVFFDSSQFDMKLFLINSPFLNWYKDELDNANWKDFNSNINDLVDVCVKQIETYFSTKQKPKQTRLMHSTERHHLSAVVAFQFPKLVSTYAKFQHQYEQGLLNSQVRALPIRSHFMDFFFYKASKRMDYSYKTKNDQDREEVPLRKPLVSQALKRKNKDHPCKLKKIKSTVSISP